MGSSSYNLRNMEVEEPRVKTRGGQRLLNLIPQIVQIPGKVINFLIRTIFPGRNPPRPQPPRPQPPRPQSTRPPPPPPESSEESSEEYSGSYEGEGSYYDYDKTKAKTKARAARDFFPWMG